MRTYFPHGTNSVRGAGETLKGKRRESLYVKLGTWATFAVLGWCVLIGSYYLVNWLFGGVK